RCDGGCPVRIGVGRSAPGPGQKCSGWWRCHRRGISSRSYQSHVFDEAEGGFVGSGPGHHGGCRRSRLSSCDGPGSGGGAVATPKAAGTFRDELEVLRLQIEALQKDLKITKERVQTLETARAFSGPPAAGLGRQRPVAAGPATRAERIEAPQPGTTRAFG